MGGTPGDSGWKGGEAVTSERLVDVPRFSFHTFDSLLNPHFRLFWFGVFSQMGALNMQVVARGWLMYKLTGSAALLGVLALANAVPVLALSIFGGIIADRVQKKYVLMAGSGAFFVIALIIALAITSGIITWPYLVAYAVFHSIIQALTMPSRQAIIPELVGLRNLTNGVALNAAAQNIERLVAPVVAGFLIAFIGIAGVYYSMAGLYLISMLLFVALPRTSTIAAQGEGALTDIKDGLRYIRWDITIQVLLVLTLVVVVLSMPYLFLLPAIVKEGLGVLDMNEVAKKFGILMTVSGAGALVGSLAVASLPDKKRGLLLLVSSLVLGAALAIFASSPWYWLSLIMMILVGLGQAGRMAISNALVQAYVVDEYRGRVMSIYMMEFGLSSLGTFFIGLLAEFTGVQWAVGGAALLLVAVALSYLAFSQRIRRLD